MRGRRMLLAGLAGAIAMAALAGAGAGPRPAEAAASLAVANGTVDAAVDHVAAGSGAFSNFTSGVLDSWLPLAHAHVDNSPFAEGTASPLDTGPAGQTVAGAASRPQPQYAEARFPRAGDATDTVGAPGGPSAHAAASQGAASATATLAGGASPAAPGAPALPGAAATTAGSGAPAGDPAATASAARDRAARLAALDAALSAWRARFLSPGVALQHPAVHPDAAEPDGAAAGTATASVSLDPAAGLLDGGDARVASVSFGGGAVVIRNLHVRVTIVNNGTPQATSAVDLGEVTVGGVPVTVGSDGVSLPGAAGVPADQLQPASQQLNAALAQGGLALRALAPAVTTSGGQETVDASVLHVGVAQPPTAPGVPRQFVDHTIGEVFADSLAVTGEPGAPLPLPLLPARPPSAAAGEPRTAEGTAPAGGASLPGEAAGSAPSGDVTPPPGRGRPGPTLATAGLAREKPAWLLLLYFAWQALVLGTALSLWWWRAAGRPPA
jgi:hypothetical protein